MTTLRSFRELGVHFGCKSVERKQPVAMLSSVTLYPDRIRGNSKENKMMIQKGKRAVKVKPSFFEKNYVNRKGNALTIEGWNSIQAVAIPLMR